MQQPGVQQPNMQPMMRKPYGTGEVGWAVDPGAPVAPRPNMSVVTTVWGNMTPGTQAPLARHPTPAPGYDMPMYHRPNVGQIRPGTPTTPYNTGQQPGFYRQTSHPSGPGPGIPPQYRPSYSQLPNGNPDYQPPPGALSAAAMAAAAATATATATATASMMVQDQPPYHRPHSAAPHPQMAPQYPGAQYSSQPGIMPGMRVQSPSAMMMNSSAGGGPMPSQHSAYRRPTPYSTHPQLLMQQQQQSQRKAQYQPPTANMSHQYSSLNPQMPSYNPAVPGQYPPHMRQPSNMTVQPNQQTYSSGAPPPYAGSSAAYPHMMARSSSTPGPPHHNIPPQSGYQNGYNSMVPQNVVSDMKPVNIPSNTEIRLNFPIRNGVLLQPFRLQHNVAVSHHGFNLPDQFYQTLMERPDSEVEFKSFHSTDQSQNWPASLSVSVNNQPFLIDRGEHGNYHKPLYLKNVCVPGRNTITISVGACCCSHSFMVQLVHRPTVKSLLQSLVRKRILPLDHCVTKIKSNFANLNGMMSSETDGVEQTSVKISLKCPITFRKMKFPARGNECHHIQCFDLESYLQLNAERCVWRCPICKRGALLEGLELDQYMWGILEQLSKSEIDEINIDANASWKPSISKMVVKEEDNKDICNMRMWKGYSPSSTNLPSVGSYEGHHNPISPYPTPPNSHNSQGSNSIAHFNGGMYDVGFNSPPDFTGPMSNRSDISENEKQRIAMLQRQAGIASPTQGPVGNSQPAAVYNVPPGGPASNGPPKMSSGPASNKAPGGPPSNAAMSQGPPSNAPASQGPPSNAPASHGGPASNAPASHGGPASNAPASHGGPASNAPASHGGPASNGPATNSSPPGANATNSEIPAEVSDLVNNNSPDDSLPLSEVFPDDLLAYLGPQLGENPFGNTTPVDEEEIFALFSNS